ncbi:hypothetical protein GCM10020331_095480 [Ectobacillus funiculus]
MGFWYMPIKLRKQVTLQEDGLYQLDVYKYRLYIPYLLKSIQNRKVGQDK